SQGATVMKFIGKGDKSDREEFVFEESKEKPKGSAHPRLTFQRYNSSKSEQALLSHFSGPMRLGAREAKVDITFGYLMAVKIQERANQAPAAGSTACSGVDWVAERTSEEQSLGTSRGHDSHSSRWQAKDRYPPGFLARPRRSEGAKNAGQVLGSG